jgi:hypothetical protein
MPCVTPLASPALLMVATLAFEEFQVTKLVTLRELPSV